MIQRYLLQLVLFFATTGVSFCGIAIAGVGNFCYNVVTSCYNQHFKLLQPAHENATTAEKKAPTRDTWKLRGDAMEAAIGT